MGELISDAAVVGASVVVTGENIDQGAWVFVRFKFVTGEVVG